MAVWSLSRDVKILKDLDGEIRGKDVLVIEDIIDSGNTLSKVLEILETRSPNSIELCTLVSKPSRREIELDVKFLGFMLDNSIHCGLWLRRRPKVPSFAIYWGNWSLDQSIKEWPKATFFIFYRETST